MHSSSRLRLLAIRSVPVLVLIAGLLLWIGVGEGWLEAVLSDSATRKLGGMIEAHRRLDPDVRTDSWYVSLGWWTGIRLLVTGCLATLILALGKGPSPSAFRDWLYTPSSPEHLALIRIATFAAIPAYALLLDAPFFAGLPQELVVNPPGWGWLPPGLLPSVTTTRLMLSLLVVTSLLAAAGVRYRITSWAVVLLGIVVLGLPQFYGKINHYHHLILVAAVLAAAPADHAWSLDGRRSATGQGSAYGLAIRTIWIVIGLCYLFPGFWKLMIGGGEWLYGRTLEYTLYAQWHRAGIIREALASGVVSAAGGLVVLWELAFIPMLFFRRTRVLAALSGLVFHLTTWLVAGINFWSLCILYVAFLPERGRSSGANAAAAGVPRPSQRWTCMTVVVAMMLAGLVHLDTWPIAVYPTFAAPQGLAGSKLEIIIVGEDGELDAVDLTGNPEIRKTMGASRALGLLWQVTLAPDLDKAGQKALAVAAAVGALPEEGSILVDEVIFALHPDAAGSELARRRIVGPVPVSELQVRR